MFTEITNRRDQPIEGLRPFLRSTFFALTNQPKKVGGSRVSGTSQPLNALPLLEKDWAILDRLWLERRPDVDFNYLQLTADYISSHASNIASVTDAENTVSRGVLDIDVSVALNALQTLDPVDRQSLFAFKLYCALHAESHHMIADYFANIRHSDWVRSSLSYPLIFYSINLPSSDSFEFLLTQVFPELKNRHSERRVVSFLLSDDNDERLPLSFKCYCALLCHPFDALNFLLTHYESLVAAGASIDDRQLTVLREIAEKIPSGRLRNLLSLADGEKRPFSTKPQNLPICHRLGLDADASSFFVAFVQAGSTSPRLLREGLYARLGRLRWDRYPAEEDFTDTVMISKRYGFCEVGRFVRVLLTSLYMVERAPREQELLHLVRHLDYFGDPSAFTVCSPSGAHALRGSLLPIDQPLALAEAMVEATLGPSAQTAGRWWIKRLHWDLRNAERSMRVGEWLARIRQSIPFSGNSRYLSGIHWEWLDRAVEKLRLRPFVGNPDGIYVLMLRVIEERQREPNRLRLALAPVIEEAGGIRGLVSWLLETYGQDALAFIRFLLTPPTILKMELAPNFTAALSARLDALETAVTAYGFSEDILSSSQYETEQRELTTALTFMRVGSAQFEISWESLRLDAERSVLDNYKAYIAFSKTYNSLPLLTDSRKTNVHVFANKQIKEYELKNRDWPLALTILGVIDNFLIHPTYGIESILALRIRHDTMRREFAVVIGDARHTSIAGVSTKDRRACISALEPGIYSALQTWIDLYMHTGRGGTTKGLFGFVPTQEELDELLGSNDTGEAPLLEIVERTIQWIRTKLESHLVSARTSMEEELKPRLSMALIESRLQQPSDVNEEAFGKVRSLLDAVVSRRVDELLGWFSMPAQQRTRSLTYGEVELAVRGRYAPEVERGTLQMQLHSPQLSEKPVRPEALRAAYDLWSELTLNAMKYSELPVTRLRASEHEADGFLGLRFSSLTAKAIPEAYVLEGEPNVAAQDSMLKAGKSGLRWVAALSAHLANSPVTVKVVRRSRSFHVWVPLERQPVATNALAGDRQ